MGNGITLYKEELKAYEYQLKCRGGGIDGFSRSS
jgi:hypothetical protein